MVELQVAFQAIRVRRDEYIFLPILRAICLLSREVEQVSYIIGWYANLYSHRIQDHNSAVIRTISSRTISPLKKVKRRVGYDKGGDSPDGAEGLFKRLHVGESERPADRDVAMGSSTA